MHIGKVAQADRDCPVHSVCCGDWILIVGCEERKATTWWTLQLYADRSDAYAVAAMLSQGPSASDATIAAAQMARQRMKNTTPPLPTSALGFICTKWRAGLAPTSSSAEEQSLSTADAVRQRTAAALLAARERAAPQLDALKDKLIVERERAAASLKEKVSTARQQVTPTIDALKESAGLKLEKVSGSLKALRANAVDRVNKFRTDSFAGTESSAEDMSAMPRQSASAAAAAASAAAFVAASSTHAASASTATASATAATSAASGTFTSHPSWEPHSVASAAPPELLTADVHAPRIEPLVPQSEHVNAGDCVHCSVSPVPSDHLACLLLATCRLLSFHRIPTAGSCWAWTSRLLSPAPASPHLRRCCPMCSHHRTRQRTTFSAFSTLQRSHMRLR